MAHEGRSQSSIGEMTDFVGNKALKGYGQNE